MSIVEILPDPAFYFPPRNGRFTVTPGLFPLGTDFGNGDDDARLFQFDTAFPLYRANKIACINERWSKYVCADDFPAETAAPVIRLITEQLTIEYPTLFERNGPNLLHCRLTNETISLASLDVSAFDALCRQIPEDIAIVRRTKARGEWVAALHLCAPSHWAAEEKIGRPFVAVHAPIPHFEKIAAAAASLTDALIGRGPFVRFAWSVTFDDRLNAHPEPPPSLGPEKWDGVTPPFLRVERQTLWGMPDVDAYLFAIRVYLYEFPTLCADIGRKNALLSALRSMSPESLRYKGLAENRDAVLAYIEKFAFAAPTPVCFLSAFP